eukprot:TRINITY_DN12119_c0_g1_i4.p1 TRINITY_DN12119_c0_g1~~TRINITY_DN12119_c0_g1_i4.p1  ORF type:complete len:319 (+),score=51.81 TRINITY_DN12119_c0_g1_i4:57-1013(+)
MRSSELENSCLCKQLSTCVPGYHFLRVLSCGRLSRIFKARRSNDADADDGDRVAVKVFRRNGLGEKLFENELRFLTATQGHGNVIELVHSLDTPSCKAIMLELCHVDLQSLCSKCQLSETEVVEMIRGVLSALQYIHGLEIVHRNVKPEHLALGGNGLVRLVDFGLAAFEYDELEMNQPCGTLEYMAPEVLLSKPCGAAVDMYACGCTFHYLLSKEVPFASSDMAPESILASAQLGIESFGSCFQEVTDGTKAMIRWLVQCDSSRRPQAEDALKCVPFVTARVLQDAPFGAQVIDTATFRMAQGSQETATGSLEAQAA